LTSGVNAREHDTATETARRRYDRVARTYDIEQALPERLGFGRLRRRLWSRVGAGEILEIGVGTGLNFRHYPPGRRVTAIDLSPEMLRRADARARREHADVDLRLMDVQKMGFADQSFDWVVGSFVFCSVPEPVVGLVEALRVLKPGGRVLLLEHVRSSNPALGRLMDLLNPIVVRISGANINRRTVENVTRAGLEIVQDESHLGGIVRIIEAAAPGRLESAK